MNILSLFYPVTIASSRTLSGETIRVREISGAKRLDVNGCPQSNPLFKWMWGRILTGLKMTPKGKALILGLGGGDLIKLLAKKYPEWCVTVIELEPEVIKIARDYFGVKESKNLQVVRADAKDYIKSAKIKFDLIIVDIYDGDVIPPWVAKKSFIKQIISRLTRKGKAIFNYASYSFIDRDYINFEQLLNSGGLPQRQVKFFGHKFFILG